MLPVFKFYMHGRCVTGTMQEFVIKKSNRVELMAMLGLFGALISAIQMYPLKVALAHFYAICYTLLSKGNFSSSSLLLFP